MAKKRVGGAHKTPRKPVQLPEDWLAVVRRLAAKRQQPHTWLVIGLIRAEAEKEGLTDLPALPWELPE